MSTKRSKVTTKKWGGDDLYSWAVFVDGRVVRGLTGLNRSQAASFKQDVQRQLDERAATPVPQVVR